MDPTQRLRKSPYTMIPVPEALEIVLKHSQPPSPQMRELKDAFGLILAEDLTATSPFPPFPASIMDGYAVVAEDGAGEFPVLGLASAGNDIAFEVSSGKIAGITTGAPVPKGADAVVKVEDTELVEVRPDGTQIIRIKVAAKKGQSIRPIGSDIAAGQTVVAKGDRLGSPEIGLIASMGVTKVSVFAPPIVSVLSTGDELVELGEQPPEGKIIDSNRPMLLSALAGEGVPNVIDLGIAVDDPPKLKDIMFAALRNTDILITSGGVSMGEKDFLKPFLEKEGTVHFGRLSMKPGKPCAFAEVIVDGKSKLVFGLPGNPVSSMTCFTLLCVPCIRKMSGFSNPHLPQIKIKLGFRHRMDPERPEFLRAIAKWEGEGFTAYSTGNQISSRLLSFRSANALLLVPQADGFLEAGEVLDAHVIGPF